MTKPLLQNRERSKGYIRELILGSFKRPASKPETGESQAYSSDQARIFDAINADPKDRSVLFFTTHKCASTFVSYLLDFIDGSSSFGHVDYARAIYLLGDDVDVGDPFKFLSCKSSLLFKPAGEIYGPIRRPVDFAGRENFRHIFFLRDPRDIVISAYYSFGFSHALPPNAERRAAFIDERERILMEGIDAYSLRAAREWVEPTYRQYAAFRDELSDSVYMSYDYFKENTASFLIDVFKEFKIADADDAKIKNLVDVAAPVQKKENGNQPRHKRSGQSGQFVNELKPETVEELNDIFKEMLIYWNFETQ